MRKTIIIVTILVLATAIAGRGKQTKEKEYPTMVKIIELNQQYDTMVAIDANGETWHLEGIEDYEVNDYAALIMNDCGTPNDIYDDEIVDMRYCGYAELFEKN